MKKILTVIGLFLAFLALCVILVTIGAWIVMLLVNCLFTPAFLIMVFGTAKISFWKAWGLSFLSSILFHNTTTSNSK